MTAVSAAAPVRTSSNSTFVLAYAAFGGLGLIAGLIGVAWPSIRAEFNQPTDALGVLLFGNMFGYLFSSFNNGTLLRRFGYGRLLLIGTALMLTGMVMYTLISVWLLLAVAAFIVGFGTGTIDAGLNNYFAQHHGPRAMNWLHACFGIGATISPLIITAMLAIDQSWRVGYGIVALVTGALLIGAIITRRLWIDELPTSAETGAAPVQRARSLTSLRMPVVWLSVALFFVYAGVEATPSVWAFTLFTESRGVEEVAAGTITSLFWAAFTFGRIFFSLIIHRFKNTEPLIRLCLLALFGGAVLLWLFRDPIMASVGLAILGFAQAPLFAILTSNTPRYVGVAHAQNAIGFQIAGAGFGFSALPSVMGVIAENAGTLEVIPVSVVIAAALLFILHEVLARRHGG